MTPLPPVILVDNHVDTVQLYPNSVLSASSEAAGHEVWRMADGRRTRTSWQPTDDGSPGGNWVKVDHGVGVTRSVDYWFIDRGHNLWGRTVTLQGSNDDFAGIVWNVVRAVPSLVTVDGVTTFEPGGDPTTGWCVTEEGALYTLFASQTAVRYVRALHAFVAGFIAVAKHMWGERAPSLGYSATWDEDAGEAALDISESRAGMQAVDQAGHWRTMRLGFRHIGVPEYDAGVRQLRTMLFERRAPYVAIQDPGDRPERAWMYQLDGRSWSSPLDRIYRSVDIVGRELGHVTIYG